MNNYNILNGPFQIINYSTARGYESIGSYPSLKDAVEARERTWDLIIDADSRLVQPVSFWERDGEQDEPDSYPKQALSLLGTEPVTWKPSLRMLAGT